MLSFDYGATRPDGQHEHHPGLEGKALEKPLVRPFRTSYKHVGPTGPTRELRDLTAEERALYGSEFAKFEVYPGNEPGLFWTQAELDKVGKGCDVVTRMPAHCAETYARDPRFYGTTFCSGCGAYFAVDEFVWLDDGSRVGS